MRRRREEKEVEKDRREEGNKVEREEGAEGQKERWMEEEGREEAMRGKNDRRYGGWKKGMKGVTVREKHGEQWNRQNK